MSKWSMGCVVLCCAVGSGLLSCSKEAAPLADGAVDGSPHDGKPGPDLLPADSLSPLDRSSTDGPGPDGAAGVNLVPTLLKRLRQIQQSNTFLFGQQNASWSSRAQMRINGTWGDWRPTQATAAHWSIFRSDMEITSAAHPGIGKALRPAVHGFSATEALKFNAKNRARYVAAMVEAFSVGALVTMHWPADNPVVAQDPLAYPLGSDKSTDGGNNDARGKPMAALVTGSSGQPSKVWSDTWLPWVRKIKQLMLEVQAQNGGQAVPILFRPFHEMLGDAHWWSIGHYSGVTSWCSGVNIYQQLYRQTVDYLRQKNSYTDAAGKQQTLPALGNLVMVWAPGRPALHQTSIDFRCLYPGDAWVDIIAFDIYTKAPSLFATEVVQNATLVTGFAQQRGKIAAIAEFGHTDGLGNPAGADLTNWYLDRFIKPLRTAGMFKKLAYAATWANLPSKYWVPLLSFHDTHPSVAGVERRHLVSDPLVGFKAFVNAPESLMLGQATLYK